MTHHHLNVAPETTVVEKQTASIKPTFASIVASHSKEAMKNVATEIFQERDNNLKRNTSIVLLGVSEKKSAAQDVLTILHSIVVYCTNKQNSTFGKTAT